MLQRLENFYLATLRLAVIIMATLLLVGVVFFAISSMRALQPEQEDTKAVPVVPDALLKSSLSAPVRRGAITSDDPAPGATTSPDSADANYRRVGTAVYNLVKQANPDADQERIISIVTDNVKPKAEKWDQQGLKLTYVKGMADSFERVLKDPVALVEFKKPRVEGEPDEFSRLFTAYDKSFGEQVNKTEEENTRKHREAEERKATGMQHLYIAGGAFLIFLSIVFLSIIIRIERNLRPQGIVVPAKAPSMAASN